MKNLIFFFIAIFFGLTTQRAAAQCTTQAATLVPADLNVCLGPYNDYTIHLAHNNDQVLDGTDIIKYALHDGTETTLGNILGYSTFFTNWMDAPAGVVPGVTYQIVAIAGNPDGNGGVDLNDPCLSFNGGVTVVFHEPPTVTTPETVTLGCNDWDVDVTANVSPPGNYGFDWEPWGNNVGIPSNGPTFSASNPGYVQLLVTDLATGCRNADTTNIVVSAGKPVVDIVQVIGGSCGQLNVITNVTGGVGSFDFLWDDGSTSQTQLLTTGTHCVSITDANGCVAKNCIVVPEPGNLAVSLAFDQSNECGLSRLKATATGGSSGNINYAWSNGTSNTSSNYDFSYGQNYVTVTDASGCEVVASYFVENSPTQCGTLKIRLFDDVDFDCQLGSNDFRLENFKISIKDAANQQVFYGNSYNYLGDYSWLGHLYPGDYTVSVEVPNALWQACQSSYTVALNAGQLTELNLSVQAVESCTDLRLDIAVGELNWCSPNNYLSLYYENKGTADASDAYIELQLEPHLLINSSTVPFTDLGNDLYRFDLGTVGVDEKSSIGLNVKVDCSATIGATPCITGTIFPNAPCPGFTDPNWSGASLIVTSECESDGIHFFIQNVGTADMTTPLSYVIIEDAVMFMQAPNDPPLQQGEIKEITMPDNGSTWRIEVQQEPLHPGVSMPALALEGCQSFGTMGFVNQFPQNDGDGFVDIECVTISAPYDPNDKQGLPLGLGEDHLIRPGTDIEYTIRFQNTGNDTANTVVIRDTLDSWIDPLSIEPGASSHPYRFDYFGEGGQIKFVFENIMLLDSNLSEPASHGYVTFRAKHRQDIPLGTDIFNRAAIYFDYNPPIFTNETQHRVDTFLNLVLDTWTPNHAGLELGIAPNPMSTATVVEVKGWESTQPVSLELYDLLGRQAVRMESNEARFILQRSDLTPGIYFVKLQSGGAVLGTGRVVVSD